jgi:serine/threonine protein kinase
MDLSPLASRLEGKNVGKWRVIAKRKKDASDSSGFFSTCYEVEDENGKKAFLKAYNYQYAFGSLAMNSADALLTMTENFTYERDLLLFCNENRMRRVVTAIDSGEYREPTELLPVPYLVFEIADGSLKTINFVARPDLSWKLLAFHGALVGLSELHSAHIAHQDIKPSNILVFGQNYSKISDLGSATKLENASNWCQDQHVGDLRYAPIELLYGYCSSDWRTRRYGADLFMMGGLLSYMVTGANFLSLMIARIPDAMKPLGYGGTFAEVKPYLMNAYYQSLDSVSLDIPECIRSELLEVLSELSNPIPEERGNAPRLKGGITRYSLISYISKIDRLAKKLMWTKK